MPRWTPFPRSRPDPAAAAAAAERLSASGQYGPALAAYRDAAGHWRRIRSPEASVHTAGALLGAGRCLGKLGRFEEAVATLVGAEKLAIELVATDPVTWGPSLAAVQEALAGAFGETGRWTEALTVSRRAVELRRAAGAPHDLAVAQRVFAQVRAAAGLELPEALAAISSAMHLHLSFAAALADPRA